MRVLNSVGINAAIGWEKIAADEAEAGLVASGGDPAQIGLGTEHHITDLVIGADLTASYEGCSRHAVAERNRSEWVLKRGIFQSAADVSADVEASPTPRQRWRGRVHRQIRGIRGYQRCSNQQRRKRNIAKKGAHRFASRNGNFLTHYRMTYTRSFGLYRRARIVCFCRFLLLCCSQDTEALGCLQSGRGLLSRGLRPGLFAPSANRLRRVDWWAMCLR